MQLHCFFANNPDVGSKIDLLYFLQIWDKSLENETDLSVFFPVTKENFLQISLLFLKPKMSMMEFFFYGRREWNKHLTPIAKRAQII